MLKSPSPAPIAAATASLLGAGILVTSTPTWFSTHSMARSLPLPTWLEMYFSSPGMLLPVFHEVGEALAPGGALLGDDDVGDGVGGDHHVHVFRRQAGLLGDRLDGQVGGRADDAHDDRVVALHAAVARLHVVDRVEGREGRGGLVGQEHVDRRDRARRLLDGARIDAVARAGIVGIDDGDGAARKTVGQRLQDAVHDLSGLSHRGRRHQCQPGCHGGRENGRAPSPLRNGV